MTSSTASGADSDPLHVRDFFLARQPILDRSQTLVAYELLFRNAPAGPLQMSSDLSATAAVIAHAAQLGLDKVIGDAVGYLNIDAAVLASDILRFLPPDKVVLELLETLQPTPEVLAQIAQLARSGFRFALDDVVADTEAVRSLLPLAHVVKLDVRALPPAQLPALARQFKQGGKTLLAEKVETHESFQQCLDLGFDYFQGYYFAKPAILGGKKLSPAQRAIIELLQLLASDADNSAVEARIKDDVALCFNLLRLVNTPALGARRIDSVGQALLVLGRQQLQRWLQIMLYAEPSRSGRNMAALLTLATTRGRLLELVAQQTAPRNRGIADTAFTVGIMSLMDTLFGMPMADILQQIPVAAAVSDALQHRRGLYGDMLALAEHVEQLEKMQPLRTELAARVGLPLDALGSLQLAAYAWSNGVARGAQPS